MVDNRNDTFKFQQLKNKTTSATRTSVDTSPFIICSTADKVGKETNKKLGKQNDKGKGEPLLSTKSLVEHLCFSCHVEPASREFYQVGARVEKALGLVKDSQISLGLESLAGGSQHIAVWGMC